MFSNKHVKAGILILSLFSMLPFMQSMFRNMAKHSGSLTDEVSFITCPKRLAWGLHLLTVAFNCQKRHFMHQFPLLTII
jgi:hypothetical protein